MRTLSAIVVASCLIGVWTPLCNADEQQAREILDKAIEAAGGRQALSKHKAATWKEEGTYYGMGEGLPYTGEYALQYPDKFKMEITDVFSIVVNGDKGWMRMQGQTQEMSPEDLAETREQLHAGWITMLIPLTDPKFKLQLAGESTAGKRQLVGIKVSSEGRRDVTLYFDRNNLLAKSETTVKSDEHGGKEVLEEVIYNGYRRIDGVMTPLFSRIQRDGEKYVESRITELKYSETLDDGVFSKP